jgi:hypothetical protein
MMLFNRTGRTMAAIAGSLLLGVLLMAPAAPAADQPTGHMIVPQEMQKGTPSEGSASRSDTMTGELSKATEKPMRAPEGGDGGFDLKNLSTPTVADYDSAVESDSLSSTAF